MSSIRARAFTVTVGQWWESNRRDFPWRDVADPYAILVSEIMLQQTQADRVVGKYNAFMRRFPTVDALAATRDGSVLRMWSGLGYNRRALNLKRAAEEILRAHDGVVPREEAALVTLPGIGVYTAKAIMAFAWNIDVAPVDTNIRRILVRHFGKVAERDVQKFADTIMPEGSGSAWSSMLMDFGALVCTSRDPKCRLLGMRHIREHVPVSRQKPFRDSDRFWRGRIVEVLRGHTTPVSNGSLLREVGAASPDSITDERAKHIIEKLVADGLIKREKSQIRLA